MVFKKVNTLLQPEDASIFLSEAISIGTWTIEQAKRSEQGIFWTMYYNDDDLISEAATTHLYSGTAGVIHFLMELYLVTNDPNLEEYIHGGLRWLIHHSKSSGLDSYSMFTGRLSVALCFLRAASQFNNPNYLNFAYSSLESVESFLTSSTNDLINGISGCLLGLVHFYHHTKDESILPLVFKFIDRLLQNCRFLRDSVYWDLTKDHTQPLCGFSHGLAGIGFCLLEVGHYFNLPFLTDLAQKTYQAENYHFQPHKLNWPDFRKGSYSKKDENEFRRSLINKDLYPFIKEKFMFAWCHGAPGIGLSRLRAHQITGNKTWLNDLEMAITSTSHDLDNTGINSYCLCHGGAGNADLLIEAFLYTNKQDYFEAALKVGKKALQQKEQLGYYRPGSLTDKPDAALFTGTSGVGLFYLRLLFPSSIHSVLYPVLPKPEMQFHLNNNLWSEKKASFNLVKASFSNATNYLNYKGINEIGLPIESILGINFLSKTTLKHHLIWIRLKLFKKDYKKYVSLLKLDIKLFRSRLSFESNNVLSYTKYRYRLEQSQYLLSKVENHINTFFKLTADASLVQNLTELNEIQYFLVYYNPYINSTYSVIKISSLSNAILTYLLTSNTLTSTVRYVDELLEDNHDISLLQISELVRNQLWEFIKMGLLEESSTVNSQ
ncbi:lanthionine synthetase LanC family protein [Spirosoma linguale]|uniref:Lanthionine synthetase C family protein n=1 Tax=Spirosoma linguale (strain ATCC 33905 / DSM 74 / LMG 10896 / Claus 1) TaxID=504472 RepID=D2QKP7_SPILD|nr:Lanthionine synthetase C family protein [Spirosoma linguale DSM 74]